MCKVGGGDGMGPPLLFSKRHPPFVIQSEAKNLGNTKVGVNVDAHEILHYTSFRSE